MTGGGFGGCIVALVKASQADAVIEFIVTRYRDEHGKEATPYKTRPGSGAHVLSLPCVDASLAFKKRAAYLTVAAAVFFLAHAGRR
jgi:hypothetical protein